MRIVNDENGSVAIGVLIVSFVILSFLSSGWVVVTLRTKEMKRMKESYQLSLVSESMAVYLKESYERYHGRSNCNAATPANGLIQAQPAEGPLCGCVDAACCVAGELFQSAGTGASESKFCFPQLPAGNCTSTSQVGILFTEGAVTHEYCIGANQTIAANDLENPESHLDKYVLNWESATPKESGGSFASRTLASAEDAIYDLLGGHSFEDGGAPRRENPSFLYSSAVADGSGNSEPASSYLSNYRTSDATRAALKLDCLNSTQPCNQIKICPSWRSGIGCNSPNDYFRVMVKLTANYAPSPSP